MLLTVQRPVLIAPIAQQTHCSATVEATFRKIAAWLAGGVAVRSGAAIRMAMGIAWRALDQDIDERLKKRLK
jgi:hypothetical protein